MMTPKKMSEPVASDEGIERIARQLCIAAGKDPIESLLLPRATHPREWMQFRDAAREALLVAAKDGSVALCGRSQNAPENKSDHFYIVSDGTYIEKAFWNEKVGFHKN